MLDLPPHLGVLARALNRVGTAMVGRDPGAGAANELARELEAFADDLEALPRLGKAELGGTPDRVATFMSTGRWPDPPPDGSALVFDPGSFVGGTLNPFTTGAVYHREGDEAVATVTVARNYEGPPDRVHGGMVCCLFDEVMGVVFRARAMPSAFTGELSVRFEAAAPIETELQFRARVDSVDGRKIFMSAEGSGPQGRFASATATFITMRPEELATYLSED